MARLCAAAHFRVKFKRLMPIFTVFLVAGLGLLAGFGSLAAARAMPAAVQSVDFTELILDEETSDQTNVLAWGDMDGDGDLDLAVGNISSNRLYRNNGSGAFTRLSADIGWGASSLAWGDMDNDGDLDLAIGREWFTSLLYRNDGVNANGDFIFTYLPEALGSGRNWTRAVAWGDYDGDGDLDLAVGNSSYIDFLYRNEGGGVFSEINGAFGRDWDYTNSLAWGDMDNDGDLDLAVGYKTNHVKTLYRNDGGAFTELAGLLGGETECTTSLAWGDMDGDGDLDLAAGNGGEFGSQVSRLYRNNGDGSFTEVAGALGEAKNTYSLAWGDMDGDGDLDLMVADLQGANKLYRNNGQGEFSEFSLGSSSDPISSVAWGDMDGDGDLDLAVGTNKSNRLYRNNGGNAFSELTGALGSQLQFTNSTAWGDVEGDGDLDLVIGNGDSHYTGQVRLYLNDGRSIFSELPGAFSSATDDTRSVAWGDFDGDGDLDLAVGNGMNYGHINSLFRNDGAGFFSEVSGALGSAEDRTTSMAWGDMDGDGDLDLAVGNWGINRLYRNDGPSVGSGWIFTEQPGVLGNLSESTEIMAWGDMDGDGDLDLAVGNSNYQANRLYRNDGAAANGDMIFTELPGALGSVTGHTYGLAWGDMDGDGDLDLAVGNSWGEINRLYRNEGGGVFKLLPSALGGAASGASSVAWGDMDGDGDLDLAFGGRSNSYLYRNEGKGVFSMLPDALAYADDIAWGDMDGDGDLDLAMGYWDYYSYRFNHLYRNPRQRPTAMMPTNPLFLAVQQPAGLAAANFYAISGSLASPVIPFTYTLFGPETNPAVTVLAQYSLNGGGQWSSAAGSTLTNTAGLWEDFDPLAGMQWRLSASSVITTGLCGGVLGNGLNFTGSAPRQAVTRLLDLSSGGKLSFSLRIGAGNYPCEKTEDGEDILLEYSLDGMSWNVLDTYNQDQYPSFTPIEVVIPPEARSSTTRLRWRQPVFTETTGDNWALDNVRVKVPHVFLWDTLASGFFGQSGNVVMQFKAIPVRAEPGSPGTYRYPNDAPGPYQQAFASATTMPFPARGTQVRVFREQIGTGDAAANAVVYRLQRGSQVGGVMASPDGQPYRTDPNGYLPGRGELGLYDTLYALLPISTTTRYTLYATNGIPGSETLAGHLVEQPGVQNLVVSEAHPLLAFNLDISLEWDARNDGDFLRDLDVALKKASEVLFDISDGQIVIGNVNVYQNRENWLGSDIVIYAQTGIRPRASMGGVAEVLIDDLYFNGRTIHNAYGPGQVRMGPNWDPFGESVVVLTVDWQRALAHELSHYLLYLPDNYLGMENGQPVETDCRGSFMTNTYDNDYSEFLIRPAWEADLECSKTIAEHTTGRVDWETVLHFYELDGLPMLHAPADLNDTNPGPAVLPLDITHVSIANPGSAAQTLPPRIFDVRRADSGLLTRVLRSQAFVFQDQGTDDPTDDQVLPMGAIQGDDDRVTVRGATAGDRLCLFGPPDLAGQSYAGCIENLALLNTAIPVAPVTDWQPNIIARAVTSTTLQVTVTLPVPTDTLHVQFFPAYGEVGGVQATLAPTATLGQIGAGVYTATLSLPVPAFEGWLRVWVPDAQPVREAMSQLFLSPPWGPNSKGYDGGADTRAWGANNRQLGAPVASGDGQVSIFNFTDIFSDTGTLSLQAINSLPRLPSWLSQVGQGYRFLTEKEFERAIAFDYLHSEVPPGYEYTLTVYYSPDEGANWERLPTQLDQQYNRATAVMPANAYNSRGIYALMATLEMPGLEQGWNLLAYSLPVMRSLPLALESIQGHYTSVYFNQSGSWKLFDATVLKDHAEFAGLVNDLMQFEPNRAYWIYATEVVTPYVGVPSSASAAVGKALSLPPATFYGWVQPWVGFEPQLGDDVEAWVGGDLCGSSKLVEWNGQLAYKLQVAADYGDECGAAGRRVNFRVAGYDLFWRETEWDNSQAWFLSLGLPDFYYIFPLIPVRLQP